MCTLQKQRSLAAACKDKVKSNDLVESVIEQIDTLNVDIFNYKIRMFNLFVLMYR